MQIPWIKQFLAVFEYEFKQAFYSKKALLAFAVISSFFFILLYWLYQLQMALLNRETRAEARIAEKFKDIIVDNFYANFPFLAECPFYITILQFYFMICIPILTFILIADIATHELRDRTFRFFAFRINLVTVMVGKFSAYVVQFSLLSAFMWFFAIFIFESMGITGFEEPQILPAIRYAFHFWFIDHAIWFETIAISLLISITTKNPYVAAALANVVLIFLIANKYTKDFMQDLFLGFIYPVSSELLFSTSTFLIAAMVFLSMSMIIMKRKEL